MGATRTSGLSSIAARRHAFEQQHPVWEPKSLDAHFDWCAQSWPDRPYFVQDGKATTYAEFADATRTVAAALDMLGLEPGDRLGVLMGLSPDFYVYKIAASRLGAFVVPLNYLFGPNELDFVLTNSRCRIVVAERVIGGRDMVALLNDTFDVHRVVADRPRVDGLDTIVLCASDAEPSPSTTPHFDHRSLPDVEHPWPEPGRAGPTDVAEIMYTSGSSGVPKGVLLAHDAMRREAFGTVLSRGMDDGWSMITSLPPFHLFGYMQAILTTTFVGGTVVLERKFDAGRHLRLIEALRVRDMVCVPAMVQQMVELASAGDYDLESLTSIFSAGNLVSAAVWARIREVLGVSEITTAYGLTEITGIAFLAPPDSPDDVISETVGMVKQAGVAGIAELGGQHIEYRVLDLETGDDVEQGHEGELVYRGPSVTTGYWENPEETRHAFVDGWLRSGDLGRIRPDGALLLTGRVKEIYKSGGENVAPREVELVLQQHPGVHQAVVVGVPDERWGEAGVAWIVPEPGAAPTPEELREHCRAHLARYKVPREVRFTTLADLPVTPSGKLHRLRLAELTAKLRDAEAVPE